MPRSPSTAGPRLGVRPKSGEEYGGYGSRRCATPRSPGSARSTDGAPPAWTLYLASDDVDALPGGDRTRRHVLRRPGTSGRSAGWRRRRPLGCGLRRLAGRQQIGASLVNEPGGLTWEDLRSTDPDAAPDFYAHCSATAWTRSGMAGPDYAHVRAAPARGAARRHGRDDGRPGGDAVALAGLLRGRGRGRRGARGGGGRRHGADAGLRDPVRHDGRVGRPGRCHLHGHPGAGGSSDAGPDRRRGRVGGERVREVRGQGVRSTTPTSPIPRSPIPRSPIPIPRSPTSSRYTRSWTSRRRSCSDSGSGRPTW